MTRERDDQTPEQLREEQGERARDERRRVEDATTEHDSVAHERRSEKAAYLAARLAERERSEQQTGEDEHS